MTQHDTTNTDENFEYEEDSNTSNNPLFSDILNKTMSRREILKGGARLTTAAFFGSIPLVGCDVSNNEDYYNLDNMSNSHNNANDISPTITASGDLTRPSKLQFISVPHNSRRYKCSRRLSS